jgi:hypothetical protein
MVKPPVLGESELRKYGTVELDLMVYGWVVEAILAV